MSGHFCVSDNRDNAKFYEEVQMQLGNAETRCSSLKQKLDQVKKVYQENAINEFRAKSAISNLASNESVPPIDIVNANNDESVSKMFEKHHFPVRQNSQAISSDKTGAAVKTINNILSGITESVNRLSEIDSKFEERNSRPTSKHYKYNNSGSANFGSCQKRSSTTQTQFDKEKELDEVTANSSTILHSGSHRKRPRHKHTKTSRGRVEMSSASIGITAKKSIKSTAKHSEKRIRLNPITRSNVETVSTGSQNKRIRRRKHGKNSFLERNYYTDNLVEIYHNSALNQGSDSDDQQHQVVVKSVACRKIPTTKTACNINNNQQSSNGMVHNHHSQAMVPPLEIHEIGENYNVRSELSPIQERGEYMDPPQAPRTEFSTCTKNYELPTIASKMKQVCKSYLRSFDFRAIPFCAAKSISPSHNIGINIQQVMNIIKTRQPIAGISPTLAHNIGLAAEKLNSRPLSALVSSLGSRITYSRPLCPLNKHQLNYQQLQEMAKEIPEEAMTECLVPIDQMNTGASGDMENRYSESMWTVDPSTQRTCTCYSQQGLGFQQVLSRYQSKMSARAINSQAHYKINNSRYKIPKYLQKYTCPNKQRRQQEMQGPVEEEPLKGKERSLKMVLQHLHDDFEVLNQKYDEVSKRMNNGEDVPENSMKKLESLEKELSQKEEEINLVMALYNQVISLKEQVKSLRELTSVQSVSVTPTTPRLPKFNSNMAFNLTKILRQIQRYQESVKKDGRY